MDRTGSLVDTCLRIHPAPHFIHFLATVRAQHIPHNILALTGKQVTQQSPEESPPKEAELSAKDIENLKRIRSLVKEKSASPADDADLPDPKEKIDVVQEKEKGGDTPEKMTKKPVGDGEGGTEEEDSEGDGPYLTTADIDWVYGYLHERRRGGEHVPRLAALLAGALVRPPPNRRVPRDPALEARCQRLRAQQDARDYRRMTKAVDNVRMRFPEDSISYQLKQINRQLIAIGQFVLSIFAGFLFGFRGVEWLAGALDFGFRMLLGVLCALVIALAEIYFLAKKLNEELSAPQPVQLGGPPRFADTPPRFADHPPRLADHPPRFADAPHTSHPSRDKEHQD